MSPKFKRIHTRTIFQMEQCECGAASLAMVLGYYEVYLTLEKLRIECNISRDGSNAFALVEAAGKYGFVAKGYQKVASELFDMQFPAIVMWNHFHYIVLEGFGRNKVYINDPALGKRVMTFDEFESGYSGIVLEFKKGESFQKTGTKPLSVSQKMVQYLTGMSNPVTFLLLTSACLLLPGFAMPAFLLVFIDVFFSKLHLPWKGEFLSLVSIAAVFSGVLVGVQLYFLNRLNTKLAVRFSSRFLEKLLKLPISFFESRQAGQISYVMSLNQSVAEILTGSLVFILIHLLFFFFFAFAMFAYDSTIAWIGLVVGVFNLATMVLLYRLKSDDQSTSQINLGMSMGISAAGLGNMEMIKMKGNEANFFSICARFYTKNLNQDQKLEKKNLILSVLPTFFQMIAWAALLGIGSFRIIEGALTIGKLMALGLLQISFLIPISRFVELSPLIFDLKKSLQSLDDIANNSLDRIFLREKTRSDKSKLNGSLEFRNVTFRYSPQSKSIVKDLSFRVEPGQRIALIGCNGCGKSTLAKLAAGIYHPDSGQILYDGIPVDEIPPDLFRNSIGHIDQDPFLFSGTVRDNITLWNQEISDEAIYKAAQDAGIHEIISLRQAGYDSFVLEEGGNFSKGERQQIQLARALLYHPSFLIFDKATNNLDDVTKQLVLDRIRTRGCSILMIVDRLSSVRHCEQVLVLDGEGNIAQRGTPDELRAVPGKYLEFEKSDAEDE